MKYKFGRRVYALAFFIPFLISVIILIGNGVYPFGEKCILHMDMYHQYYPFFMEFREKLVTGGSMMYSWNLGLGSDFVSLYAYYLSSPWNLLLVLWPKDYVIEFMTLQIIAKIGLCGLTFFFYLKETFHLKGKDGFYHSNTVVPALVFSTAYALSGYLAAYSWDIMWLDCVVLFPMIMVGLKRLVWDGKVGLYYLSLAICIFSNYYISIMICLFLVFVFFFEWTKKGLGWRKRGKALLHFSLYSLLAGGTSAVLLLPEILILKSSGSAGSGFPETMEWYFSIPAMFTRGATTASVYTGTNHWPNLYAGAFSLVLVWLYLWNKKISFRDKFFRFLMLGFLLLAFANNYLDFIWHGFHFPQSLPARQSFLYIFLLLSMGFATLRLWKGTRMSHILSAVVLALVMLLLGAVFGDEGVTETNAILLTALFVMAYGMAFVLLRLLEKKKALLLRRLVAILAIAELTVNMAVTGFGVTSRTAYMQKWEDYQVLLQTAKEDYGRDGFFRVEDTGRKTKNDDALYGYASATIFSSLMPLEVSHLFQSLYMEGGLNFYSHNGATPLTSAMCSVQYMLSDSALEENRFYTKVAESGNNYLYRCNDVLPLGFMMEETVIDNWKPARNKRLESLNSLVQELGSKEKYLKYTSVESKVEPGSTVITIPEEGYYYATYAKCGQDRLKVSRTDGFQKSYAKTTHRYLLSFGDCEAGEEVTISNTGGEEITFSVYRLNVEAFQKAYDTLAKQSFVLEHQEDCRVDGRIQVESPGRLVFSVPYVEGWEVTVDGEKTPIVPWQDAWIGVPLSKGEHQVTLQYRTPGLRLGFAISACCIGLFLLLYVISLIRRKRRNVDGRKGTGYEKRTDQYRGSDV